MRNILITAYSLEIGGIETSLIRLLNNIDYDKCQITLLLYKKEGQLLDLVPKEVEIIEYMPFHEGNVIIRKVKNRYRYIKFIRNARKKYDLVISYVQYVKFLNRLVLDTKIENYVWIHTDLYLLNEKDKVDDFINEMGFKEFDNIVFVSHNNMDKYLKGNRQENQNYIVCKNYLDKQNIIDKSKEKISDYKKSDKIIFVNIARHEEKAKKLSRLIEAVELLNKEYDNFELLLVGGGPQSDMYLEMIKERNLKNIKMLGLKTNPYPYFKLSDCFVLTSDYEGDPVTVYEALTLDIPIITTNVGDVERVVTKGNGIIVPEKSSKAIYEAMKKFLNEKNKFKVTFDIDNYNLSIKEIWKDIFEGDGK